MTRYFRMPAADPAEVDSLWTTTGSPEDIAAAIVAMRVGGCATPAEITADEAEHLRQQQARASALQKRVASESEN